MECSKNQSDDHYHTFKENINWANYSSMKKNNPTKITTKLIESDESNENNIVMPTSSTPIKKCQINETRETEAAKERPLELNTIPHHLEILNDHKEWNKLRAIKEYTDRELYQQIMQHQHKFNSVEKLNEPPRRSKAIHQPNHLIKEESKENFVRNSPKRQSVPTMIHSSKHSSQRNEYMMDGNGNGRARLTERLRRTIDAECSHCVVDGDDYNQYQPKLHLKSENTVGNNNRKIGGILTREDILQKLKEFCWKSQNGTFFKQCKPFTMNSQEPLTQTGLGLSPVSYVSVETDQQSNFRNSTPPQPIIETQAQSNQRKHGLSVLPTMQRPLKLNTQNAESVCDTNGPSYAYVMKRNNRKELEHKATLNEKKDRMRISSIGDNSETSHYPLSIQPIYVQQNPLKYHQNELIVPVTHQQILVNGENVLVKPVQIINNFPLMDINTQYQYVKPQQVQQLQQMQQLQQLQLQHLPPNYCYIMVREPEIIHHHSTALQQSPTQHLQIIPPIYCNNYNNNIPNMALERFIYTNSKSSTNINQMYQNAAFLTHHPQQQQQQQHQQQQQQHFWMSQQRSNMV